MTTTQVKIVDTVLRDAHQSLVATRMSTEQMVPILETMDRAGYFALEVWAVRHSIVRYVTSMKIHGKGYGLSASM